MRINRENWILYLYVANNAMHVISVRCRRFQQTLLDKGLMVSNVWLPVVKSRQKRLIAGVSLVLKFNG